jgi:hypothetical protein
MWGKYLHLADFFMSYNVEIHSVSTSINIPLFNRTRKFLKQAGVEYSVDMRNQFIIVNNGTNSAFSLKFETYNYVRVSKIPRGKIEILFQANSPEWILKKLFDYRIVHFTEVSRIMTVINSRPKPLEVVELPPVKSVDHNKPGFLEGL